MNTVLITGASAGIGKEMARLFAQKGYNMVLVARRRNLLEELKEELSKYPVKVEILAADVSKQCKDIYDFCKEKNLDIDILVNNAGYGQYGAFADSDLNKALGMIDLNNRSLVELTYYFLKDMKERKSGEIINVGSVASFQPGPSMAVYYATKSFVLSFSLALREELKKDNIGVSVLCPAPTKTEFWDVAEGSTSFVYSLFSRTGKQAAETGMKLVDNRKPYMIDGPMYKIFIPLTRLLNPVLSSKIIGAIQSRTKGQK